MMINVEAIIQSFWPLATGTLQTWNQFEFDERGLKALDDQHLQTRRDDVRDWLRAYAVFQGINRGQRDQIAEAVLVWADSRVRGRNFMTPQALADAHAELMEAVSRARILNSADAKKRDFTSLASKALWLCYPDSVPIYDNYAKTALYVIGKLEIGITPADEKKPKYEQFVHVWKQIYSKYEESINSLELSGYPYRVRIFDTVLWLIGRPSYRVG